MKELLKWVFWVGGALVGVWLGFEAYDAGFGVAAAITFGAVVWAAMSGD